MGMINVRTGNLMYAPLAENNETKFVSDFRNEKWLENATGEVSKIFFEIIGIEENKIEERYGKVTLDAYYAYGENPKELPMRILLSCERNEKDIAIHSKLKSFWYYISHLTMNTRNTYQIVAFIQKQTLN